MSIWHQLPISRLRLYGEKLAAILSLIAVPHIINFGVFFFDRLLVRDMMFALYVYFLGTTVLYAVLASLLCFYMYFGNSFDAIVGYLVTCLSWAVLLLMVVREIEDIWPGYNASMDSGTPAATLLRMFIPGAFVFNFNDSREIVWWVYWVGYTLICFFIACGTYIRRPSERAGQPSTDRPIYRLISVVVSIVCGLVGSKMFSAIWDSVLASAIGFFLLSFLGHVAAELIVSRGSSGLLRSMKYYLIAIVITAAGLLILMFDVGALPAMRRRGRRASRRDYKSPAR